MSKPVSHHGKWRIRYFDHTDRRCSAVFDSHKEAKEALIANKQRTIELRRSDGKGLIEGKTFNDICDYWITHRVPQKRSGRADLSIIEKHLRPFYSVGKLTCVTIEDIDRYKGAKISELNVKTIHNHLTLLISMLRVAKELRWIDAVPKIKKPRCNPLDSDFRYLKNSDEVRRFLLAAEFEGERTHTLYATAIYTGLREGELAGLQWSDVDFDRDLITVHRSFDGPTKSGRIRHLPILAELKVILQTWRLKTHSNQIFTNQRSNPLLPSDRIFQETLHRVLARANFSQVRINGELKNYIRFHDLRHTFASHWVMNGGDLFKLQKILGHQSIQMTMRYAHLSPNAFKEDLERLSFGGTAKVLPLRVIG